jgi:hypothetical protein
VIEVLGERLRDWYELTMLGEDRRHTVPDRRALVRVGNRLQAASGEALGDLPLEVASQLAVEGNLRVGEDRALALLVRPGDVVDDQGAQAERVEVHAVSVRASASRASSRKPACLSSKALAAAG